MEVLLPPAKIKIMKLHLEFDMRSIDKEIKDAMRQLTPEFHKGEWCIVRAFAETIPNRDLGFGDGMGTRFRLRLLYRTESGNIHGWEDYNSSDHPKIEPIAMPIDWIAMKRAIHPYLPLFLEVGA